MVTNHRCHSTDLQDLFVTAYAVMSTNDEVLDGGLGA